MDFLKMLKPQLYGSLSNTIDLVLSKSLKGSSDNRINALPQDAPIPTRRQNTSPV